MLDGSHSSAHRPNLGPPNVSVAASSRSLNLQKDSCVIPAVLHSIDLVYKLFRTLLSPRRPLTCADLPNQAGSAVKKKKNSAWICCFIEFHQLPLFHNAGPVVHFPQAEAVSGAGGALVAAWLGQRWQDHGAETAGSWKHQHHYPNTGPGVFPFKSLP